MIGQLGECTCFPAVTVLWDLLGQGTEMSTSLCPGNDHVPYPQHPTNKKVAYFLYPRLHAELQGYENKQDNSYIERP